MDNENNFETEERRHYESLISFFKWCIGICGSIIGLITAVAIYFTYSNSKDMRDDLKEVKNDYANTVKDLKSQIADLKTEGKETVSQIRNDSREAVTSTKEYSENELSRISSSTRQVALTETQKQLDYIFGTDKIQNLIQTQAVKEIKSKVVDIVADQTKNVGNIADAGAEMRAYNFNGRLRLRSYFIKSKSSLDSIVAKQLYDQISDDFYAEVDGNMKSQKADFEKRFDSAAIRMLRSGELPKNAALKNELMNIMNEVNGNGYDLYQCIIKIYELRALTGISFQIIDIEAVNKWYDSLKK